MNQEVGIQLEKSINTNVRNNTFNILQLETDFFKLGKYTYILYRSWVNKRKYNIVFLNVLVKLYILSEKNINLSLFENIKIWGAN